MVLSNLSNSVDVETRAMATMGDTLGGSGAEWRGSVQVAHIRGLACVSCWPGHQGSQGWRSLGVSGIFFVRPVVSGGSHQLRLACLCLFSFKRPLRGRTLLLPHGPGWIRGLYKEDHEACLDWIKPQVSTQVTAPVFLRGKRLLL